LSYVIGNLRTHDAAVIDPQPDDVQLIQALLDDAGLSLHHVLYTHMHDVLDAGSVKASWPGAPQLSVLGGPLLQSVSRPGSPQCLPFGDGAIHVLPTPGHTSGCLSYLWHDRLFCGDALAVCECHRQPYAVDPARLWDSVTREILRLPGETLLFGAHAAAGRMVSNVHEQRLLNEMFSNASRDACLTWLMTMRGEAMS
jgi:glyoxylase-like metal-dependent hydrolase (beta-lactamase superfamily II)